MTFVREQGWAGAGRIASVRVWPWADVRCDVFFVWFLLWALGDSLQSSAGGIWCTTFAGMVPRGQMGLMHCRRGQGKGSEQPLAPG